MRCRLGQASSPRLRSKLTQLLAAAQRGVLTNPTATPPEVCAFFFSVASAGLEAPRVQGARVGGRCLGRVPRNGREAGTEAASCWQYPSCLLT